MRDHHLMTETFRYELKVPRDRIAVLIGQKGEAKQQLEQQTKSHINIDSNEGEVHLSGTDAIMLYALKEIIRAIGRGFNPETALQLLKQDYGYEQISIFDYARTKKDLQRLKGRVIGEEGKSRKTIEELTECSISVYGKTVGLIGQHEWLPLARRAVEALLSGSPHANVYKWLERRRRELRRQEITGQHEWQNK